MANYERKFTELSRYVEVLVAAEVDHYRMFERGLRQEILTSITATTKLTDFSKLVEIALRVEQSFLKAKQNWNQVKGLHQLVVLKDESNDNLHLVYRVKMILKLNQVSIISGRLVKEVFF